VTLRPDLLLYADTVTIWPQSTSLETLNAIQHAIDTATPEGRVIQLESGVYDLSGVLILNPPDPANPPAGYSAALGGTVHFYNPYNLPPDRGYGLVISGRKNIVLRGAPVGPDGMPPTILQGNTDPRALNSILNRAGLFNIAITVGGDAGEPSQGITVERIYFQSFATHLRSPGLAGSRFAGGTEDLLVRDNVFENVFQGVGIFGKHLRPVVQGNAFLGRRSFRFPLGDPDLFVYGHPVLGRIVDAQIENNVFSNGRMFLGPPLERTTVRDNTITTPEADSSCWGGTIISIPPLPARTTSSRTIRSLED
jgi:hypothetical protein